MWHNIYCVLGSSVLYPSMCFWGCSYLQQMPQHWKNITNADSSNLPNSMDMRTKVSILSQGSSAFKSWSLLIGYIGFVSSITCLTLTPKIDTLFQVLPRKCDKEKDSIMCSKLYWRMSMPPPYLGNLLPSTTHDGDGVFRMVLST